MASERIELNVDGSLLGDEINTTQFGGEYLGWTGFPGWEVQANYFDISHFRWPGGIIAEDRVVADGYAFDISEPNIVDNWTTWNGSPRPSITEMFAYSHETSSSFSMIIPTARYVESMMEDEVTARQWIRDDIEVFTARLLGGEWGALPDDFTLEIGAEYYSTDVWEENSDNPEIANLFAEVFAEIVSELSAAEQAFGGEAFKIAVQAARFQSNVDTGQERDGEEADAAIFLDAYLAHDVASEIDGLIWHRYVYRFEQIDDHLALDGAGPETTLSEHLASWEISTGSDLDLVVSWASPDIDSTGASITDSGFDYGPRSALNTIQMFSYLTAAGTDYATIYGIDSPWTGAVSTGGTTPDDYQIRYNGEVFKMLAESLQGLRVLSGFEENHVLVDENNMVLESDILNVNAFSDAATKTVAFVSAWDLQSEDVEAFVAFPTTHAIDWVQVTHIRPDTADFEAIANYLIGEYKLSEAGIAASNVSDFDVLRFEFADGHLGLADRHEYSTLMNTISSRSLQLLSSGDDFEFLKANSSEIIVDAGEGDDVLTGASSSEFLIGGGGEDDIRGGDGSDIIFGDSVSQEFIDAWLEGSVSTDWLFQ